MKRLVRYRLGVVIIGLLAAVGCGWAQQLAVEVNFIETRGWDRLASSNEDWSRLANRPGMRVLAAPRMTAAHGERVGTRLASGETPGAGVRAVVTPSLARGGVRIEGHASVTVPAAPGSRRAIFRPPVDTAATAFNRTVLPGQSVTVHLGRRWEVQVVEDRRARTGRIFRENVLVDYYVSLSADRADARR